MMENEPIAPPHHVESEQSVLGALLLDNDAIDRIGDLRTEHFFRYDHRLIFQKILALIHASKAADVITVFEALSATGKAEEVGGLPYLNALSQNTPSSANIKRYSEIVLDRALRRGLITETSRLADLAFNPAGKTAAEVLDIAQGAIMGLAETRTKKEPIHIAQSLTATVEGIDARYHGAFTGVPTGFAGIDQLLNGGFNRGNLIILGARPSMGKTALALNIALNIADKHSALFLSMEMGNGEITDRCLANICQISLSTILRGDLADDDWPRLTHGVGKLQELNLHIDDQGALTLMDVRSKARMVKRKHGLDVLVVDYLQLMSGEGDNRNSQIEVISRGLKALAKELDCVVLALSQLSRNAANKQRPQLNDLRDSGAIEQDADIIIFLHRAEVDDPSTHMRGIADVFIAKNRQGRIDDVMLGYNGPHTRFSDFDGQRPAPPKQDFKRGLARDL